MTIPLTLLERIMEQSGHSIEFIRFPADKSRSQNVWSGDRVIGVCDSNAYNDVRLKFSNPRGAHVLSLKDEGNIEVSKWFGQHSCKDRDGIETTLRVGPLAEPDKVADALVWSVRNSYR